MEQLLAILASTVDSHFVCLLCDADPVPAPRSFHETRYSFTVLSKAYLTLTGLAFGDMIMQPP